MAVFDPALSKKSLQCSTESFPSLSRILFVASAYFSASELEPTKTLGFAVAGGLWSSPMIKRPANEVPKARP